MGKKPNPDSQLKAIGERVRDLRIKAGYSSYDSFADYHDMTPKQYWRLETGKNFMMTSLLSILKIHKITLEEFFKNLE
ncbi:MAG: XRE family transcriptional regulator [Cyclobacteriaceae bacterium]|nr:XRE family transcriptional regulator [Cyclobacteriaceae bacterium]